MEKLADIGSRTEFLTFTFIRPISYPVSILVFWNLLYYRY